MSTLPELKSRLDGLKTQLAVATAKRDEVAGTLRDTYGLKTPKQAKAMHIKLTGTTIPALQSNRDTLVQQAEEVLNGIDSGGGNKQQAQPGGASPVGGPRAQLGIDRGGNQV